MTEVRRQSRRVYAKNSRGVPVFGAMISRWEKFAEAVTVAVFGSDYQNYAQKAFIIPESAWRDQQSRMIELLNGWR